MKVKKIDDLAGNLRRQLLCRHAYAYAIIGSLFVQSFWNYNRSARFLTFDLEHHKGQGRQLMFEGLKHVIDCQTAGNKNDASESNLYGEL